MFSPIARLAAALVFFSTPAAAETIIVFSAASLSESIQEIADRFSAQSEHEVLISLGSSSTLARQIEAKAPANIFISANLDWMEYLTERDAILPDSQIAMAQNSLVIVAPTESDVAPLSQDFGNLPQLLSEGRLAIGDPSHVPAGVYAKNALEALGVWDQTEQQLAPGSNVRAVLRFVEEGAAPLGIVYRTDAVASDRVKQVAQIPMETHPNIVYLAAITAEGDSEAARALLDFMAGDEAVEILTGNGFVAPVVARP